MTQAPPLQLIVGAAGHGVVKYATDVAGALRRLDDRTAVVSASSVPQAVSIARESQRVHLHVTDRLLGGSLEDAADNLERLAEATRLTITLHDVPQTSDGGVLPRRIAAYSRFLAAASAAAVNSRHEQHLVTEFIPGAREPHAIPLGARLPRTPRHAGVGGRESDARTPRDFTVLMAGFVYPGKGHEAAIHAAAQASEVLRAAGEPIGAVVVRAIGRASAGHEGDIDRLGAEAERVGIRFEVTGFLDDAEFFRQIAHDGIPLAAHEHVSASRTMLDWVEAGRRPLVLASRYASEMATLRPGTMTLYDPADLPRALADAWRQPARSWLEPDIPLAPSLTDVAADYRLWWDAMAAG